MSKRQALSANYAFGGNLCCYAHRRSIGVLCLLTVQRYTHLKLKPGDLINDGMFKFVRNPNYIGEALIYLGFVGAAS